MSLNSLVRLLKPLSIPWLPEADAAFERFVGAPYIFYIHWQFDGIAILIPDLSTLALAKRPQCLVMARLTYKDTVSAKEERWGTNASGIYWQ